MYQPRGHLEMLDDCTKTFAGMKSLNGIICFSNSFEVMSDKVINWKFSSHAFIDQNGDISARFETSKGGSFPDATSDELKGSSGDFVPRCCHSDNTADSPSTVST
jgi:hypothetical protein